MSKSKIQPNVRCPCFKIKKFKNCCEGKVDWDEIIRSGADFVPYLSTRGRNFYFFARLCKILQLDLKKPKEIADYKKAFTAEAVRAIHEAVIDTWPSNTDLVHVLKPDEGEVSSLYIGDYDPEYLTRAIVRQSVYTQKILIIDPFTYPSSVKDEFNPISNPNEHRFQTLKNVNFWRLLMPWVKEGIVEIIRPPGDLNPKLNWESIKRQKRKFEENPKLKEAVRTTQEQIFNERERNDKLFEELLLCHSDADIQKIFYRKNLDKSGISFDKFLSDVQQQRKQNINFLEPLGEGLNSKQKMMMSFGTSYDMALITAKITQSYLVTDLHSKWLEIEIDRDNQNPETKVWAPFSKAFQDAPLKFLNNVSSDHALQLRTEGRLDSLRTFLHRVWKKAQTPEQFDSENAVLLAEELKDEVAKADEEWKKIDKDLIKLTTAEVATGALAAGPLIATGHGMFLTAAAVVAGTGAIINSTMSRKSFPRRYPAAFFMNIDPPK